MKSNYLIWFGAIFAFSLMVGITQYEKHTQFTPDRAQAPKKDIPWSQYISAHTAGLISKKSKITIRFVNEVTSKNNIGKNATHLIQFEPNIIGTAEFRSTGELVFIPKTQLTPGMVYQVKLRTNQLSGFPSGMDNYNFSFAVIKPQFEINVYNLSTTDKRNHFSLKGTLVTSDIENVEAVEKTLKAKHGEQNKTILWTHHSSGKHHEFLVSDIKRQESDSKIILAWNGESIGSNNFGKREVEVPKLGVFHTVNARAIQDGQQYILLQFTDKLKPQQNLKGLVEIKGKIFTSRIDGNSIKLYPKDPLQGDVTVVAEAGIKSQHGDRIKKRFEYTVHFTSQKPQVRFVGKGIILPDNDVLSIPFEAVNVHSVQVTAFQVFEKNMGQFFQTNQITETEEIGRVGRYIWRKTIPLSTAQGDRWNRYALDATSLLRQNPGSLFRLTLSINRSNSTYNCSEAENEAPIIKEKPLQNNEDINVKESSGWDFADTENEEEADSSDKGNPCKNAYYFHSSGASASGSFFASNIGMIVKRDAKKQYHVITTDIRYAKPLAGVLLEFRNFQNQIIASVKSDKNGFAKVKLDSSPFYLSAKHKKQRGYLKINSATKLATSHFDVGGQKTKKGTKGYIYGERGVWRPGDNIHLVFVLEDKTKSIPKSHPVSLSLFDPSGNLVEQKTNTTPTGEFYRFQLKTADNAPTGNWLAKVQMGGSTFSRSLKIETVVPNRLRVELNIADKLYSSDMPLSANLFGQWLHGATADGLKADIAVSLYPIKTRFGRFTDYIFDDPAREFRSQRQLIFDGSLDEQGQAEVVRQIEATNAPGMLKANFTSRVFEKGGNFSTGESSATFFPYDNYVGIKLPKGDRTRGMLLTDTEHTVHLASLDAKGEVVSLPKVEVTMYKISWKWWWDKTADSLTQYAHSNHSSKIKQSSIFTVDGKGKWKFQIKYPDWGRYMIRACDTEGNHCTGKIVYIDWPGWAGRAQEGGSGPGASVLTFSADKNIYQPGDTAILQLPNASQGRALLSLENGSRIVAQRWVELKKDKTQIQIPITAEMAPNVYASVTLIQPHNKKKNDRPIRLYGIIPLNVKDPGTILKPVIKAAKEWQPNSEVDITVSEGNGKPMTYTLAVVDEGLLGLTSFKTPNLHKHFYKKEILGINTWDMFDHVVGAYGADLENLLAIGGDDSETAAEDDSRREKRFPPVVRFFGPFKLKANKSKTHRLNIPQYVGALRSMVVAGESGAYGNAHHTTVVRKDLMLLPNLPRVVGPNEEFSVPISIFTMDKNIKNVDVTVMTDSTFDLVGSAKKTVNFSGIGEKIVYLNLKAKEKIGKGIITISGRSGKHNIEHTTHLNVRNANPMTSKSSYHMIDPGKQTSIQVSPHGIAGSNSVKIEASSLPPINLEKRLGYLIRYPHGCVEQVTSSVFPQLYLSKLLLLNDEQKENIQRNVQAGVEKLRSYQNNAGGFRYWPGGHYHAWANNYVGHFLLEAQAMGYQIPVEMMSDWINAQKQGAQSWTTGGRSSSLEQAYRLFTLALAKKPELSAMNRLRESGELNTLAKWYLAAAYKMAGQTDAALSMIKSLSHQLDENNAKHHRHTFGSRLRDSAIVLQSLLIMKKYDLAQPLVTKISSHLSSAGHFNTHALAYSLAAMANYYGSAPSAKGSIVFSYKLAGEKKQKIKARTPLFSKLLASFPDQGKEIVIDNPSKSRLYFSVIQTGSPKPGEETASNQNLQIEVDYTDSDDSPISLDEIKQGMDLVATVTVKNLKDSTIDNIALSHIFPSGFQIQNLRLKASDDDDNNESKNDEEIQYQDIRDDRVYTYFNLKENEEKEFTVKLNATYLGKYYLPAVSVESMYDHKIHARNTGQWIEIKK